MTVRVVTAPVYQPVSRTEARLWMQVDEDLTDQDTVIDMLIKAATARAELITGRAFVQRELQLILPCWPDRIELPHPPLVSVESITYIDTDGTQQTLDTDIYDVHTWREPGFVCRAYGQSWPAYRSAPDAIRVNYTAGYDPVGSPVGEPEHQAGQPSNLKLWMQAYLATLYEHREQIVTGTIVADLPKHFCDGLLDDLVIGSRLA